ncbi:MAG: hypothetical protein M9921_02105 [Fimbriimonadaceae bacterium]|nr:hypothetical protein [Fimbriimonadaceae bacterium]
MRATLAVLAVAWAATGTADRLILIPTGSKLPFRTFRTEHLFDTEMRTSQGQYYGLGIGKSFDAAVVTGDEGHEATFDFSFSYLDPVVNYAPGLTLGMVDALDRSEEGRRLFVAITYRSGLDGAFNSSTPAETTLGAFFGSRNAFFVGASLPFSRSLRLLIEHDSERPAAGLEFKPAPSLAVRWVTSPHSMSLGVSLSGRM